jgi:hypothetical protein
MMTVGRFVLHLGRTVRFSLRFEQLRSKQRRGEDGGDEAIAQGWRLTC